MILVQTVKYLKNVPQGNYEFNNISVTSDGFMLISQYADPLLTVSYYKVTPIILIEITRLS